MQPYINIYNILITYIYLINYNNIMNFGKSIEKNQQESLFLATTANLYHTDAKTIKKNK